MSNFKELDEFKKLEEVKELSALWFSLPQAVRFIITGGYNTAVGYILFIAALYVCGKSQTGVQAALLISYILSSFNSYLAQKFLVFRTRGNYVKEYFKALSVWAAGYVINAVLLIAVLSVFAVAQPDNTLFWIGGACNYSWSFLPFLWITAWLRLEYKSKGALDLSRKGIFFCLFRLSRSAWAAKTPARLPWALRFVLPPPRLL